MSLCLVFIYDTTDQKVSSDKEFTYKAGESDPIKGNENAIIHKMFVFTRTDEKAYVFRRKSIDAHDLALCKNREMKDGLDNSK
jgi:hypothetical protein